MAFKSFVFGTVILLSSVLYADNHKADVTIDSEGQGKAACVVYLDPFGCAASGPTVVFTDGSTPIVKFNITTRGLQFELDGGVTIVVGNFSIFDENGDIAFSAEHQPDVIINGADVRPQGKMKRVGTVKGFSVHAR